MNKAYEGDATSLKVLPGSLPEARGSVRGLKREVNPDTGQVTLRDSAETQILIVSAGVREGERKRWRERLCARARKGGC